MNSRRIVAALFVILCVSLSGLVLRQQFAAHPAPPPTPVETFEEQDRQGSTQPEFVGEPVDKRTWHLATPQERQAVTSAIQAQLNALRDRDSRKAGFYQSRSLRRSFRSAEEFTDMVRSRYPEFGHCRLAKFGPVWADADGRHADVPVMVTGENGKQAQALYEMVRERGIYRVAGVIGGHGRAR